MHLRDSLKRFNLLIFPKSFHFMPKKKVFLIVVISAIASMTLFTIILQGPDTSLQEALLDAGIMTIIIMVVQLFILLGVVRVVP